MPAASLTTNLPSQLTPNKQMSASLRAWLMAQLSHSSSLLRALLLQALATSRQALLEACRQVVSSHPSASPILLGWTPWTPLLTCQKGCASSCRLRLLTTCLAPTPWSTTRSLVLTLSVLPHSVELGHQLTACSAQHELYHPCTACYQMKHIETCKYLPGSIKQLLYGVQAGTLSTQHSKWHHVSWIDKIEFAVQGEEQGAMSISLPRVSSAELLLFPETAEGHVSKVLKAAELPVMHTGLAFEGILL